MMGIIEGSMRHSTYFIVIFPREIDDESQWIVCSVLCDILDEMNKKEREREMRFLFFLFSLFVEKENKFNQRLTMLGEYAWRHQLRL